LRLASLWANQKKTFAPRFFCFFSSTPPIFPPSWVAKVFKPSPVCVLFLAVVFLFWFLVRQPPLTGCRRSFAPPFFVVVFPATTCFKNGARKVSRGRWSGPFLLPVACSTLPGLPLCFLIRILVSARVFPGLFFWDGHFPWFFCFRCLLRLPDVMCTLAEIKGIAA